MENKERRSGRESPYFIDRVGERYLTNQGYWIEIIKCFGSSNCSVSFDCNGVVLNNLIYSNIKRGQVANPYHPSMYGVGYMGQGKYVSSFNYIETKEYRLWKDVLERCYNPNFHKKRPNYADVKMHSDWHNFQNFATWVEKNFNHSVMEGWSMDKDLKVKGNKIYSPETCIFIPIPINNIFVKIKRKSGLPRGVCKTKNNRYVSKIKTNGKSRNLGTYDTPEEAFQAYKIAKEIEIKRMADEWRPIIGEIVYKAMYNWVVEIND